METPRPSRMRPVIILPEKQVSKRDIKELRNNGICVIEAKDPSLVRFCEPPPQGYSVQERAAIRLCRVLLDRTEIDTHRNREEIGHLYAQLIIEGTPLDVLSPMQVKKTKS